MPTTVTRHRPRPSTFALQLMLVSVGVCLVAALLAWGLSRIGVVVTSRDDSLRAPPALWASTVLLATGSWWLQRSVAYVRREKQRPFRRCLLIALAAGTAFVGVQSYGLQSLLETHRAADPQAGAGTANGAAFVFVLLHALHFTVALFFLVYVTLRALNDRYDHEYYWGVTACAGVWHFLGGVWLAILAVFAIVR